MRVMVFFDLPTITEKNRHDYRKFRQFLVQECLKLFGLKISKSNDEKIMNTVYSLIDVVEYLNIVKLLIFVNLKLYLDDKELEEVYKYAMYKKVNILLIETGKEKKPINNEKIIYIDSDYDEIVLYNR